MTHSHFKKLTDTLAVSPQISINDIDTIVAAGFSTVICNRPDHELSEVSTNDEPHHNVVKNLLLERGIEFVYQPVSHITPQNVEAFDNVFSQQQAPILAYCASGTRCTVLWALGQTMLHNVPVHSVTDAARLAGYEIGQFLN